MFRTAPLARRWPRALRARTRGPLRLVPQTLRETGPPRPTLHPRALPLRSRPLGRHAHWSFFLRESERLLSRADARQIFERKGANSRKSAPWSRVRAALTIEHRHPVSRLYIRRLRKRYQPEYMPLFTAASSTPPGLRRHQCWNRTPSHIDQGDDNLGARREDLLHVFIDIELNHFEKRIMISSSSIYTLKPSIGGPQAPDKSHHPPITCNSDNWAIFILWRRPEPLASN